MAILTLTVRAAKGHDVSDERFCYLDFDDARQMPSLLPEQAQRLGWELFPEATSIKATYLDDEGDLCTLTERTAVDALAFARLGLGGDSETRLLEIFVWAASEPAKDTWAQTVGQPLSGQNSIDSEWVAAFEGPAQHTEPRLPGSLPRQARDRVAKAAMQAIGELGHEELFTLLDPLSAMLDPGSVDASTECSRRVIEALQVTTEPARSELMQKVLGAVATRPDDASRCAIAGSDVISPIAVSARSAATHCDCCGCEHTTSSSPMYRSLEWSDCDICEQCHGLSALERLLAFGIQPLHQFQAIAPGKSAPCAEQENPRCATPPANSHELSEPLATPAPVCLADWMQPLTVVRTFRKTESPCSIHQSVASKAVTLTECQDEHKVAENVVSDKPMMKLEGPTQVAEQESFTAAPLRIARTFRKAEHAEKISIPDTEGKAEAGENHEGVEGASLEGRHQMSKEVEPQKASSNKELEEEVDLEQQVQAERQAAEAAGMMVALCDSLQAELSDMREAAASAETRAAAAEQAVATSKEAEARARTELMVMVEEAGSCDLMRAELAAELATSCGELRAQATKAQEEAAQAKARAIAAERESAGLREAECQVRAELVMISAEVVELKASLAKAEVAADEATRTAATKIEVSERATQEAEAKLQAMVKECSELMNSCFELKQRLTEAQEQAACANEQALAMEKTRTLHSKAAARTADAQKVALQTMTGEIAKFRMTNAELEMQLAEAKSQAQLATQRALAAEAKKILPGASAKVLGSEALVLGIEATEDTTAPGDATDELISELAEFGARQAYRIGRISLPAGTGTEEGMPPVPVCARVKLVNDGQVSWPGTAVLVAVAGDSFGMPLLPLGTVEPGEALEVVMDLTVGLPGAGACGTMRSMWAASDAASGALLGPLLAFEVS